MTAATRHVRVAAVIAAVLAALVAAGCGSDSPGSAGDAVEANATVVRVVDGDTLVVDVGGVDERLRLIGINTPELI